jgi:hypothetical protein
MSATADIGRYRDYFTGLGRGERVEVIAIPSSPQHQIYQKNLSYLEQVLSSYYVISLYVFFVPTIEQICLHKNVRLHSLHKKKDTLKV